MSLSVFLSELIQANQVGSNSCVPEDIHDRDISARRPSTRLPTIVEVVFDNPRSPLPTKGKQRYPPKRSTSGTCRWSNGDASHVNDSALSPPRRHPEPVSVALVTPTRNDGIKIKNTPQRLDTTSNTPLPRLSSFRKEDLRKIRTKSPPVHTTEISSRPLSWPDERAEKISPKSQRFCRFAANDDIIAPDKWLLVSPTRRPHQKYPPLTCGEDIKGDDVNIQSTFSILDTILTMQRKQNNH